MEEYCELLNKVYHRITIRKVIKASNSETIFAHPTIQIEVIPPKVDGPDPFVSSENEDALWEQCLSDEDEITEFEYHYFENDENLTVKKHKKRRPLKDTNLEENNLEHIPMFPAKEPVIYNEDVIYHQNKGDYRPVGDDYVSYVLADFDDVLPLGYVTEQFLVGIKNDVALKIEDSRKARRE